MLFFNYMNNLYELYAARRGEKLPRRCPFPWKASSLLGKMLREWGMTEQIRLQPLWEHWEMVMGPELAGLAWPLGHKGEVLFVGGEDAMAVQELHFQEGEILERVNAFLDAPQFRQVHLSLLLGRRPLNMAAPAPAPKKCTRQSTPRPSGKYLAGMDPQSPVARAYARFARR